MKAYMSQKETYPVRTATVSVFVSNHSDEQSIHRFLKSEYDPGNCPVSCVRPNRLIRVDLTDCIGKIEGRPSVLTVLKPLVLSGRVKAELPEYVRQWKKEIHSLEYPEEKTGMLIELLEYAVLQKFPKLTIKEVQKMLELTPLDKTVAGQELIQIGMEKGMEKGILIGNIHTVQRILKQPLTPARKLAGKSVRQLKALASQLESELC